MYKRILSLLFLIFVITALPLLMIAKQEVHNFDGTCDRCHLSPDSEQMIFLRDIDYLCKDCHRENVFSHPSGQRPNIEIPEQFPLDWAGRMTCATCHTVHEEKKYLLRGTERGRRFCYSCHKGTFESHQGIDHLAHSESAGSGRDQQDAGFLTSIDSVSLECMGCHDSSVGSSASTKMRGIWSHDSGGSHPIGIAYMRAFMKKKGSLVHPSRMNPSVKLFDGKIGCGSCHNIFSKEKSLLTVKQGRRAGLCLSCHMK